MGDRENPREEDSHWAGLLEHLRERLGCSKVNLKLGLAFLR